MKLHGEFENEKSYINVWKALFDNVDEEAPAEREKHCGNCVLLRFICVCLTTYLIWR
jgi:hypothetical protein